MTETYIRIEPISLYSPVEESKDQETKKKTTRNALYSNSSAAKCCWKNGPCVFVCAMCVRRTQSPFSLNLSLVRSLSAAFSFVRSSTCVYSWDDARWCIDTRIIYRYRSASTFTALDSECSSIPSTESSLVLLLLLSSSLLVFHI